MTTTSDPSARRRVKFYKLNNNRQWDDKGTGYVSATFINPSIMSLVIVSETDGSHLLESKIEQLTPYQKQQETLIVWSESDNVDLALSFQEKTGCDEIWQKICNVQGKDSSVEITQDIIDDYDDFDDDIEIHSSNNSSELPPCDSNHLEEINEMFLQVTHYPLQREKLATLVERSNYIHQLTQLFHKAENLEDGKSLKNLYEIIRSLILFNHRGLYELIFSDQYFMDIAGMLEYSTLKPVKHRDFLQKKANFKEVLPINGDLKLKIQQTFHLQYIQDSCLPPSSMFEDKICSNLAYLINLNKIDIITRLKDDPQYLSLLFNGLQNLETPPDHRCDLLNLLKEFCIIVHSLKFDLKELFFFTLFQHRALKSIFTSFNTICIDILQIFIDNRPSAVRDFFMNDLRENGPENLYLNTLIDQLTLNIDSSSNIIVLLKSLFDTERMVQSVKRNEKEEFLNFLYKYSVKHLLQPLVNLSCTDDLKEDLRNNTLSILPDLLEMIVFCLQNHQSHMHNHIIKYNAMRTIVSLLRYKRSQSTVLGAIRVIRRFITSRDEAVFVCVVRNNVIDELIVLLDSNRQYNMLNSAILELFQFVTKDGIVCLIRRIIERHSGLVERHEYTDVFRQMRARYDKAVERLSMKNGGVDIGGEEEEEEKSILSVPEELPVPCTSNIESLVNSDATALSDLLDEQIPSRGGDTGCTATTETAEESPSSPKRLKSE